MANKDNLHSEESLLAWLHVYIVSDSYSPPMMRPGLMRRSFYLCEAPLPCLTLLGPPIFEKDSLIVQQTLTTFRSQCCRELCRLDCWVHACVCQVPQDARRRFDDLQDTADSIRKQCEQGLHREPGRPRLEGGERHYWWQWGQEGETLGGLPVNRHGHHHGAGAILPAA